MGSILTGRNSKVKSTAYQPSRTPTWEVEWALLGPAGNTPLEQSGSAAMWRLPNPGSPTFVPFALVSEQDPQLSTDLGERKGQSQLVGS